MADADGRFLVCRIGDGSFCWTEVRPGDSDPTRVVSRHRSRTEAEKAKKSLNAARRAEAARAGEGFALFEEEEHL